MIKKTICLVSLVCLLCTCGTTKKQVEQQPVVNIEFSADSAYLFCAAQCSYGPRVMNSEAHEQCGEWIRQKFQQYGYQVEMQKADLKGYDGTILKSTNIIAKASSQAKKAGGATSSILICAHWDSRPWADNDPDSANWHNPVMAANDGASGVAVMLENGNGADSWALGAQHWAKMFKAQSSASNYQYAILLDMVGGQGAKFYQEGYSLQKAKGVVEKVWQSAASAGYGSFFPKQEGGMVTDDHVPVNDIAQIPCIDIINYYPDCQQSSFGPTWHTIHDNMQHIDKNTLQAVGQTLVQLLFSE